MHILHYDILYKTFSAHNEFQYDDIYGYVGKGGNESLYNWICSHLKLCLAPATLNLKCVKVTYICLFWD